MAHNQDARSHELAAAAREGFNAEVTKHQMDKNPALASLAQQLGGKALAGLDQVAAGAADGKNMPTVREAGLTKS
jgi:hypothetical protein